MADAEDVREALYPFAQEAYTYDRDVSDENADITSLSSQNGLTVADLRRARSVMDRLFPSAPESPGEG